MPVKLNSTGGGSVTLTTPSTASDFTLTAPAQTATLITNSSGVLDIGSGQIYKDASGNVGIGTSSPGATLNVVANTASDAVRITQTGAGNALVVEDAANPDATPFVVDANGIVGMGTNTLAVGYRLEVAGNAKGVSIQDTGSAGTWLDFKTGSGTVQGNIFYSFTGGYMSFGTAPAGSGHTERARITSGGNVLIGTSTDNGAKLRVTGNAHFDNLIYSPGVYNQTTASATNMHIATDGNFFRSTSSRKYKRDIQDATFGLSDVLALRPVTYKGKSEADRETVFGGLIAEEVHAAGLTEFVQYAEDGTPDALAYGNMVSLCIKAIQELKAENDDLKARLTALEAK